MALSDQIKVPAQVKGAVGGGGGGALSATEIQNALDAGSGTASQVVRGDGTISALVPGDMPNFGLFTAKRITSDQGSMTGGYAQNTVLFNTSTGSDATLSGGEITIVTPGRLIIVANVESIVNQTSYATIDKYTLATTTWTQEWCELPYAGTVGAKRVLAPAIIDVVTGDKIRVSWLSNGSDGIAYVNGFTKIALLWHGKAV